MTTATQQAAKSFYFTFGTHPGFPYRLGWVEVKALDMREACEKFRAKYPDRTPGLLNCAFCYDSEQWARMDVKHSRVWDGARKCWDIIE